MKLKIEKSSMNQWDYVKSLRKQKIKTLGTGAFATVFQHPTHPDVVVKVARIDEEPDHDPYLSYVKSCLKLKGNPFVPKIYNVRVYEVIEADLKSVNKLARKCGCSTTCSVCSDGYATNSNYDSDRYNGGRNYGDYFSITFLEKLYPYKKVKEHVLEEVLSSLGMGSLYDFEDYGGQVSKNTKNKQLESVLKELRKLYSSYNQDIHSGNVMWRMLSGLKHPQLVVTDPVA